MAKIDVKFMKGNRQTAKAMGEKYVVGKKPKKTKGKSK